VVGLQNADIATKGGCHGNHFWLSMGYNFSYMIASDTLFDFRG